MLAREAGRHADVGAADVRDNLTARGEELGVPESEHEARCEGRLVVLVRRDNLVDEREEFLRVVEDLDVDVEHDVVVLGLHQQRDRLAEGRDPLVRRLVRDELVEASVVLLRLDGARPVRGAVEKRV